MLGRGQAYLSCVPSTAAALPGAAVRAGELVAVVVVVVMRQLSGLHEPGPPEDEQINTVDARVSWHAPPPPSQRHWNVPVSPLRLISAVCSLTVTSAPAGTVMEPAAGAA